MDAEAPGPDDLAAIDQEVGKVASDSRRREFSPSRGELKAPESRASNVDFTLPEGYDVYQSRASTSATTHPPRSRSALSATPVSFSDFGVEIQQLEINTRAMVLELLAPATQQLADTKEELQAMQQDLKAMAEPVQEHWRTRQAVDQISEVMGGFRQEMARWDKARQEKEVVHASAMSSCKTDIDNLRYQLTNIQADIDACSRGNTLTAEVLETVQSDASQQRRDFTHQIDQLRRNAKDDAAGLEARMSRMQCEIECVDDRISVCNRTLSELGVSLRKTDDNVELLTARTKELSKDKATVDSLQSLQEDVRVVTQESNRNISSLKQVLDKVVEDVKEHFRTATRTMADQTSRSQEQERAALDAKVSEVIALQGEIMAFKVEAEESIRRLDTDVSETRSWAEKAMSKFDDDLREFGVRGKKDRKEIDMETHSLHERLATLRGTQEQTAETIERIGRALWTLTQSDRVASALDQQDTADKGSIALLGFKEEKGSGGGSTRRGASSGKSCAPVSAADQARGPVINVDQRCLSCSGQASTVLSGFKMACLQYRPGPVNFGKKWHSRVELLDMREKLLQEANDSVAQWGGVQGGELWQISPSVDGAGRSSSQPSGAAPRPASRGSDRPSSRTAERLPGSTGPGGVRPLPPLPLSARG